VRDFLKEGDDVVSITDLVVLNFKSLQVAEFLQLIASWRDLSEIVIAQVDNL